MPTSSANPIAPAYAQIPGGFGMPGLPYGPVNNWGPLVGGSLNMYHNIDSHITAPVMAPFWVDLSLGLAYSYTVMNNTATDITSGELIMEGADADPNDSCIPGPFTPLDPVTGCDQIVSGMVTPGPVRVEISPERPIRAYSQCQFAAPCPRRFLQIVANGLPAGFLITCTISSLRRAGPGAFAHLGPLGYIPQPLAEPFGAVQPWQAQLPPPQTQPEPPPQQRAPRARQPAE